MYGHFASSLTAYTRATVLVFKATTTSVTYLQRPFPQTGPGFATPEHLRVHLGTCNWKFLTFRSHPSHEFLENPERCGSSRPSCPVRMYPTRLARPSCFSGPARLVSPKHVYLMKFTCCAVNLTVDYTRPPTIVAKCYSTLGRVRRNATGRVK
ncbi:hypothetical protein BDN67DRAFT_539778 [Paxillus ammoniavirescens]|nr:hypothetical protein BDN67DRAFT_539778 [Paxillus ammoniavirescens]